MGQALTEKENELYKRIDEVTHYIWDPIGVNGCPGARDEYYSYLPKIFELAQKENSESEIAEYLNYVQSERMGLKSDIKRCKEIASIIIDWSENLGILGS
ncbi:hypothetical protein [Sediminispirochaeta smaragdinae]|uniref:Uncharacterized protein n=1 Tax=Sediminispirochaeta smaragdinae (strain DSM 11293 / JCM 15392 / SEBR 4228) TaxID=573413 RepID=E1R1I6_SEDSS|nr:hypothetical protein [Sediminispirochaeta smaragdinae]ADK81127.1 conserved hypothetical protein [Sediminispirochaeta smaragdinae DSM 11293]